MYHLWKNLKTSLFLVSAVSIIGFVFPHISYAQAQDAGGYLQNFNDAILSILWTVVNSFFGWLVGATGLLLDFAINQLVIGFGSSFMGGTGEAVDRLWTVVRDLFNIGFIFGLVYIGFKMILRSDETGTKRWLVYLILAALLVNFSLFITKFVIDFTNILATEIVETGFRGVEQPDGTPGDRQIAGTFVDIMEVGTIWKVSPDHQVVKNGGFTYIFGAAMVFLVLAFVFAAGAILIVIRFIALNIYMVFSPLMFLGWVFPQFSGISKKYWSGFLGRAFFAPIYVLLLYLAAYILDAYYVGGATGSGASVTGNTNFGASFAQTAQPEGEDAFGATMLPFAISIGFLLASVIVASKLGADGANTVIKVGNNLRGRAQRMAGGATAGMAARGLRNSVGRGAYAMTQNQNFKNYAARSYLGQQAFKMSDAVANTSFDARQIGGVGKQIGVGEGLKGGYEKSVRDRNKADEEFAKKLGTVDIKDEDGNIKEEYREQVAARTEQDSQYQAAAAKRESAKTAVYQAQTELATVQDEIVNEKSQLEQDLADLHEQYKASEGDGNQQNSIRQEMEDKREQLRAVDQRFETRLQEAQANVATANQTLQDAEQKLNKAAKSAQARAEAQITYQNQIAFMDRLERQESFWRNNWATRAWGAAGGTALGGKLGATMAGVGTAADAAGGGAGLLIGVSTVGAQADRHQASRKNLLKQYGKDGTKMAKREKRKRDADLLAEAQKELTDSNENKQDEEGSKDDTSNS